MIDEDLRDFCLADQTIADIVGTHFATGRIPAGDDGKPIIDRYVWVSVADEVPVDCLGFNRNSIGEYIGGLAEFNFSVECVSSKTGIAKQLARAIQRRLHGHSGSFGENSVEMIHVESKDDNYEIVNEFSDSGFTTIALDVLIQADENIEDT